MNEDLWFTPPTEEEMVEMYRKMRRIRLFEERIIADGGSGEKIAIHSCAGHEAVAVGVISLLRPDDFVLSNHRPWGHALSKGITLKEAFGELLGRECGVTRGIGGEMHISAPDRFFLISSMIIGACIPLADGAALSVKQGRVTWDGERYTNTGEKTDQIVVVFCGEATTTNAQFHEGLTLAKTLGLPVLICVENNWVNGNVPGDVYMPTELVTHRTMGYGVRTNVCDGSDVLAVHEAAQRAINHVRKTRQPYVLEALVARVGRHKIPRLRDVRPDGVKRVARMRDPLPKLENALQREGIMTWAKRMEIETELVKEMAEAVEAAKASPLAVRP